MSLAGHNMYDAAQRISQREAQRRGADASQTVMTQCDSPSSPPGTSSAPGPVDGACPSPLENATRIVEQTLVTNTPTPHPSVVWTKMPDGAVLFSTETEVYYSVNVLGAFIWTLLPRSIDDLCAAVGEQYPDVANERIHADIVDLLKELEAAALIQCSA